jgi:hypothetical protein
MAGAVAAALTLGVVGSRVIGYAPPPAVSSAAETSEIALHLAAGVPGATVRIDEGPSQPLPVETHVPRDGREHTLRVEAPGYVPRSRTVTFETDLRLSLALAPVSEEQPSEQK